MLIISSVDFNLSNLNHLTIYYSLLTKTSSSFEFDFVFFNMSIPSSINIQVNGKPEYLDLDELQHISPLKVKNVIDKIKEEFFEDCPKLTNRDLQLKTKEDLKVVPPVAKVESLGWTDETELVVGMRFVPQLNIMVKGEMKKMDLPRESKTVALVLQNCKDLFFKDDFDVSLDSMVLMTMDKDGTPIGIGESVENLGWHLDTVLKVTKKEDTGSSRGSDNGESKLRKGMEMNKGNMLRFMFYGFLLYRVLSGKIRICTF